MSIIRHLFFISFALFLPIVTLADINAGGAPSSITGRGGSGGLKNPLSGISSIDQFVVAILNKIVLPIGAVVVVIFIIYSGFLFVTARGNESQLEKAKHVFLYVIIGSAILLGSVIISGVIGGTLCQIAPTLPNCPVTLQPTVLPRSLNP